MTSELLDRNIFIKNLLTAKSKDLKSLFVSVSNNAPYFKLSPENYEYNDILQLGPDLRVFRLFGRTARVPTNLGVPNILKSK